MAVQIDFCYFNNKTTVGEIRRKIAAGDHNVISAIKNKRFYNPVSKKQQKRANGRIDAIFYPLLKSDSNALKSYINKCSADDKWNDGKDNGSMNSSCINYILGDRDGAKGSIADIQSNIIDKIHDEITLEEYWNLLNNYSGWGANQKEKSKALKEAVLKELAPNCERDIGAIGKRNEEKEKSVDISNYSRCIILYGPPGTGKTRKAKILAYRIICQDENIEEDEALNRVKGLINRVPSEYTGQIQLVQFHPSYSYFDFVEGIEAGENGFQPKAKIFREICNRAAENNEKSYVLIIDEINRADIASVLGELLYGIEYRGEEVDTTLKEQLKSPLNIPENLYIIGTMNTADQTIANIDYAVRRRFAFVNVPSRTLENEKLNGKKFATEMYEQVKKDIIVSVARGVRPEDIMPGVSYFIHESEEQLEYKIKYELMPLLKEYAKNGLFTKRITLDSINRDENCESLFSEVMNGTYKNRLFRMINA